VTSAARVLVVGPCEGTARWRRLADLELLRARTAVDAIGEAAQAADEGEPVAAVILGRVNLDRDDRDSLEESLNRFAPGAVMVDEANADAALARLIGAADEPEPSAPACDPEPVEPRPEPGGAPDDESPAEALLEGRDPARAVLESARRRLGDPTIAWSPRDAEGRAPGVPVARRGVVFGGLTSERTAPAALAPIAEELALWLALAEQHRQLRRAAFTDSLTGARNRRWFDYALPRALDRARRERRDVTVMVFDIDDFKSYNDRFGHAAGDEILSETVRLLMSVIRPSDRVCRIGGDEFAVIFDDPSGPRVGAGHHPRAIADIAERFQRQICEHHFPKLGEEAPGTLTISGGLATFPWDGATPEALLDRADALALESKRAGKNVLTYGPGARQACGVDAEPHS